MLLCVSVFDSCHCYLTLLSGTPSKYQLCTSSCASIPWIPHRDVNIFVVLPWLLTWGFPCFLIWCQVFVISRPSHLSTFFSYLGFFPLLSCLCSFFILPASHHHLPLSAQFFGLFSAIHIDPSASLLMTQWISVVSISVQHVALTHRPEEWSCGCSSSLRSMLSMLPPACPAASCHQPSHYCSLYCSRTSSLTIVLAFPLLFHET